MIDEPEDIRELFAVSAPSAADLSAIAVWASKALALEAEIEQAEAQLRMLKQELAQIEERDLPQAMLAARMTEFTMDDGSEIKINDVIQGSLSKDPKIREYTLQWLIDHGGLENIKRHFEVNYTKGQYSYAVALRKLLQENQISFYEFEDVHHSTLKAFLAEKIRESNGKDMPPFDNMGIRYFKKAGIIPGRQDR